MWADICEHCDGTGERDFLSGAKCLHCNGTGLVEMVDDDDRCDKCGDADCYGQCMEDDE